MSMAVSASVHELRQVVDVFRGRGVAPDAEPLQRKNMRLTGAQVSFERQGFIEDFMDQCLQGRFRVLLF